VIDIGANLAHDSFDSDRKEVLDRAVEQGVTQIIVTGSTLESALKGQRLAAKYPHVLFTTAGVHPHHADEITSSTLQSIADLAGQPEVRAIGETGLDFFRDFSPRPVQEEVFVQHIELASTLAMPLFMHERDAYPRFFEILKTHRADLTEVVVHCFTGDRTALFAYLDLDCHIGITGWICDERRGLHLIPLVTNIPADRLMIETDAPYLLPRNITPKPTGRRNEPCYLPYVCRAVAAATGRTQEQVAEQTSDTARYFFRL
jgi:TatD DNase family protein|tara:strand:+ start:833 stop:1612 length:780 start_codon:yes stop_codon:yes gene_type:complete